MSAFSIRLLGSFSVTDPDGKAPVFRSGKVRALLAYLLVDESELQHREQLMALLWPHVTEGSARDSLRSALYHLRKALPARTEGSSVHDLILTKGRSHVYLNRDYGYLADVEQFVALLEQARQVRGSDWHFDDQYRALLEQAIGQYHGPFLADINIADSGPFEEWSQGQRVRFRTKMLDALSNLALIHLRRQEFEKADAYVNRQLELDNLRESAYRCRMEIMARSGRVAEAGRVYEELARLLRAELGMAPGSQTTALLEQIRSGTLTTDRGSQLLVRGYQLREKLGEGAFGAVFQAVQTVVDRVVAVKVVKPEFASQPEFIRRFEAEAQIVARLEHPNIVPLYDYWREPEGAYLVMRYLSGGNLEDQLDSFPGENARLLKVANQIARALAHAHDHGVIHRDLKPANILLDEAGNAYLSDFGIAKDLEREVALTSQESLIGSPAYISPEQILSEAVTAQTDIYTFGVVLFELLTGQKPFRGASLATLIYKHLNEDLPLITELRPDLPDTIDHVIKRATAKNPADRFASPLALMSALHESLGGEASAEKQRATATVVPELVGRNPYLGLRAFQEADADLFFGRSALVAQLIGRWQVEAAALTTARKRFLAVVGPSGSGKSSAVKAGLLPALRSGALRESEAWYITEMVPGSHPFEELETALRRVLTDAPPDLLTPLRRDERGLIRVLRHSLPGGEDGRLGQLVLVIDQFEELFTLVTEASRREQFIELLLAALEDERSQLRLIVTLRADFYDRPLQHAGLGELLRLQTEVVLPLTPAELEEAIRVPAEKAGLRLQNGLVAALVADVNEQPGGLPLLQYALTEIAERRQDNLMTLAAYHDIGGLSGAIGRRAEALFQSSAAAEQAALRQLFLRLVTLGEGIEDTRRRTGRSELAALFTGSDTAAVLGLYGRHRLLTFDHDPATREPTVEVAHEALIREWPRLRTWLEESRDDIRWQRRLAQAAFEWQASDEDSSFLLAGARLQQFVEWQATTTVALADVERQFLQRSQQADAERRERDEKRRQREYDQAIQLAETERLRAEEQSRSANRLRQRALVLAGVLIMAVIGGSLAVFFGINSSRNATAAESNLQLAVTNEAQAVLQAELAATNEALALGQQATAQVEAALRATAQRDAEDQAAVAATRALELSAANEAIEAARADAEARAQLFQARELALASLQELDNDPELSILLALESLEIQYSEAGEDALRQALAQHRILHRFEGVVANTLIESPDSVRFTADGAAVVLGDRDRGVVAIPLAEAEEMREFSGTLLEGVPIDATLTTYTEGDDGIVITNWDRQSEASLAVTPLDLDLPDQSFTIIPNSRFGYVPLIGSDGLYLYERTTQTTELVAPTVRRATYRGWELDESGRYLATIDGDNIVFVVDLADGNLKYTRRLEGAKIAELELSEFGELLATADELGRVTVWDLSTNETVFLAMTDDPDITDLAISFDHDLLGTISLTGEIRVWEFRTDEPLFSLRSGEFRGSSLDFSADGQRLVTLNPDGIVLIWNIGAGGQNGQFSLIGPKYGELEHSADGVLIAVSTEGGQIEIRDASSGALLKTLSGHPNDQAMAPWIAFHPISPILASSGNDRMLRLWELETGTLVGEAQINATIIQETQYGFAGADVAFSPDGSRLATAGADGMTRLWNLDGVLRGSGPTLLAEYGPEPVPITRVLFSSNGSMLYTSLSTLRFGYQLDGASGVILVRDVNSGDIKSSLTVKIPIGIGLAVDRAQQQVAATTIEGGLFVWDEALWDLRTSSILQGTLNVSIIAFHPTNSLIVYGGSEDASGRGINQVKIWDLLEETIELSIRSFAGRPSGVSFHPSGSTIAVATQAGELFGEFVSFEAVVAVATDRLTRELSEAECQAFLNRSCQVDGDSSR